jgi:hypothetical protein
MQYYLGKGLQIAGMVGVGVVLYLNLWPQGLTMITMLQLIGFSVLLFFLGTTLLQKK